MKKSIQIFVIFFLAFFLVITSNHPAWAQDNGNQDHRLKEKVFVHYPAPGRARPPTGATCQNTINNSVNDFGLAGWQMPTAGMTYKINTSTAPDPIKSQVIDAIKSAFDTWTKADSKQIFKYGGLSLARSAKYDRENLIAWKAISSTAIAITYVWYYPDTKELVETDTIFNKNLPWNISPYSGDCISSPTYDVQNIATHEFGHWVGLDDLYNPIDGDLTMYGYGALGELKKDTLGPGDITGVNTVAP